MAKRKTHEEFIKQMNTINPSIEIIGEFIKSNIAVKCRCKIDGHEWEARPNNLTSGKGCPECCYRGLHNNFKKTHKQFIEELRLINPDVIILGEYVNSKTKILCQCPKDGYKWEVIPGSLLQGYGCPKCGGNKQRTHDDFIEELLIKNPNIEPMEQYNNSSAKIKFKCKIHGAVWETTPNHILNAGTGCPKCGEERRVKNRTKTHDQFAKELFLINPNIELIGKYKGNKSKIDCKCRIDGFKWSPSPSDLLNGCGCPECGIKKRVAAQTKTHMNFVEELNKLNPNIEVQSEYKGAREKIILRCKIDNYIWEAIPTNVLRGSACPKCNASRGEKNIGKYLKNNFIQHKTQHKFKDCKYKSKLVFDFYLPKLNIAIEYDGIQHFAPIEHFGGEDAFKQTGVRDRIKENYCKSKGIKLIRIPYTIENIEEYLEEHLNNNTIQLSIL